MPDDSQQAKNLEALFKGTSQAATRGHGVIGNVLAAPENVATTDEHRQLILQNFESLPKADRLLILAELGTQIAEVGANTITAARQTAEIVEQAATASDAHKVEGVSQFDPAILPYARVTAAIAAGAVAAKEMRELRAKKIKLEEYQLMLDELQIEIAEKYKAYQHYLGEKLAEHQAIENAEKLERDLKKGRSLTDIFKDLEKKSLSALIAEQAHATFYNDNKPIPHANIYQLVIDEKIKNMNLEQDHKEPLLRQYVISQQHLMNVRVATPLYKTNNRSRYLTTILAAAVLGTAIAVAVASFGVFSPAAAGIIAAVSIGLGISYSASKAKIKKNERKVESKLKTSDTAINALYTAVDSELPTLSDRHMNKRDYDAIADELKNIIYETTDRITMPLHEVINAADFDNMTGFEKIMAIRQKIHDIKKKTKPWRYFAMENHAVYKLINTLDLDNRMKAESAIASYKNSKIKAQRLRLARERKADRTQLHAEPRLNVDVDHDSIQKEHCESVAKHFFQAKALGMM